MAIEYCKHCMLRFPGKYSISNTKVHVLQWVIEKGRAMNRSSVPLVCHTMPQNGATAKTEAQYMSQQSWHKKDPSLIQRSKANILQHCTANCDISTWMKIFQVGHWTIHNNPSNCCGRVWVSVFEVLSEDCLGHLLVVIWLLCLRR